MSDWKALCAQMVSDLEAELPIAGKWRRGEIRRQIASWRKKAQLELALGPVAEAKKPARLRTGSVAWRLGQ